MAISVATSASKLAQVKTQLSAWRLCTEKALAHLSSLSNLVIQLEALNQGKLGVLSKHPQVSLLLEVQLIQAMEKALSHLHEENKSMIGVVKKMKKYSREEQVSFEKSVRTQGLEACCSRSAVNFSHGEHCQWLKQLYAAHRADLDGKSRALQQLRYTKESLRHTCSVWGKEPGEIKDVLHHIEYSTSSGNEIKCK